MTSKRKLKRRVRRLEAKLAARSTSRPPTYETVTICWDARTVTIGEQKITATPGVGCLSFPTLSPLEGLHP